MTYNSRLAPLLILFLSVLLFLNPLKSLGASVSKNPIVSAPLRVGQIGASSNLKFDILEYRSYIFIIECDYIGDRDLRKLYKFFGIGTSDSSSSIISVHLLVERMIGKQQKTLFDRIVRTSGSIAHGVYNNPDHGYLDREVITINLKPGTYRSTFSIINTSAAFSNRSCRSALEYHPYVKFIPGALQ